MAIKVQCTDGLLEIGGDFNAALTRIKAVAGRQYDPATKTWTVPVGVNHFEMCGLPLTVLSGNATRRMASGSHQTRYGNVYSAHEWAAGQELYRAEAEVSARYSIEPVKAKYRAQLTALGIPARAHSMILSWDFEEQVEIGRIQFSSDERRAAVFAIYEAYTAELDALYEAERDAQEAARDKVLDKWGIE